MKIANTLFATVAMLALAGPAFAQSNPTLLTTASNTQAAVTTNIAQACALTGSLTTFTMSVSPNGAVTTAANDQPLTVTCNTPAGKITIGSDDMVNALAPAIVETAQFTKTIEFTGRAKDVNSGYFLDTRANGDGWSSATVGNDTTQRIRSFNVGVRDVAPAGGLLPVAGAYSGLICVTIDPSNTLSSFTGLDNRSFCTAPLPVRIPS